jgi:hypothetical protein
MLLADHVDIPGVFRVPGNMTRMLDESHLVRLSGIRRGGIAK